MVSSSSPGRLSVSTANAATTTTTTRHVVASRTQNDYTTSIWDIAERFTRGKIRPAPHQRNFVWSSEKIRAWVKTMLDTVQTQNAALPTGFLLLYQVPGDDTVWLNDGYQRLSATTEFITRPERFKLTAEQAKDVAQNFYCSIQHRQYRSHEEAMTAFQFVNFGTPLTSAEFCKGLLMQKENSNVNWLPTMEDLHKVMSKSILKVTPMKARSSDQAAYWLRHDYSLFYRYLSREKKLRELSEPVSQRAVSLTAMQHGRLIEQKLRIEMEKHGIERVILELEAFRQIIENECSLISSVWIRHKGQRLPMSQTVLRWLLNVAIWRRNSGVEQEIWLDFLNALLIQQFDGSRIAFSGATKWRIIGL